MVIKKNRFFILIVFIFINFSFFSFANEEFHKEDYEKVRAIVVREDVIQDHQLQVQIVEARLLEGPLKGYLVQFKHPLVEGSKYNIPLHKDMKIFLTVHTRNNELVAVGFIDVVRDYHLKVVFFLFVALLILFGGFKGVRSFIALLITAFCIIYIFIPLILKGHNFILSSIIVSFIIVITSFILISGFTRKSLSAIMGTIGGTITSAILAIYFGNKIYLTGISDEMLEMLVAYSSYSIDYRGLLYSGIIIGALGAVMDVSMTITSIIYEIKSKTPKIRMRTLFFSGLSVGRDIMATMTNTLILAYVGTSLPLLLIFIFSDMNFTDIINSQYIASEIIRSLCGSIGLIMTIPITSVVAAINS
ncbi:YibE/F family protein [Clostridium aceticum]|uniref:YibE/F family protein n=1 Tax=Clostridium aceticum TaxID=84022 RepID=A0A0G3W5C0_9CLOT|nr:YibE/F family protein [Clostridium aceticum]AKL93553.1 YibE/F family protein [Clostridium aceticum]